VSGTVGNALKIPIVPFAVNIGLPIIGRFFVATGAVHGGVQRLQLTGRGKRHAVNHRTDREAVGPGVNADIRRRVRTSGICVGVELDVIQVKGRFVRAGES